MGASATDEISVLIKDNEGQHKDTTLPTENHSAIKPADDDHRPSTQTNISFSPRLQPVIDFSKKFMKCIHDDCPTICKKAGPHRVHAHHDKPTLEQRLAYKRLMEDMGYADETTDVDNPSNVMKWTVHALVLLVFVVFLVTTWNVPRIKAWGCLHLKLHSWVALLMVLVSGLPVVRFATYVATEPLVWLRRHHKYTVYFARKLKSSVDVTLWLGIVLWVWYTFFRPEIVQDTRGAKTLHTSEKEYTRVVKVVVKQITRLMLSVTIGAFIWTVKTAVFCRLKADLLYGRLCDRIRYAILHLHVIQFVQLNHYWDFLACTRPKSNRLQKAKAKAKSDPSHGDGDGNDDEFSFWMAVSRLRRETAPTWILNRLNYTYLIHMTDKPDILKQLEATNDEQELLDVAKTLLSKITNGQSSEITPEDLKKYGLTPKEINHVFELLAIRLGRKREQLQKITQDEFLRWVVLAVKNCLGLERIVESSKHIFWKLNLLMSGGVISLVLVIWLLLSEAVTTAQLAILFTPIVSASFIFGKSLREIFDGIIFVFGMHPFDLDDRVIVDDVEMKVKKLNILTTVFTKYDTGVEAIYPNSELSTKLIVNLDITPDQSDFIEFTLPIDYPEALVLDLQVKIKKNLDDNLAYSSNTTVTKKHISDKDITIDVHFKYLVSYFSTEIRARHRSNILTLIVQLRKELEKEIKSADQHNKEYEPLAEAEVVPFKIDTKVKLPKIDDLKNQIMCVLGRHDQSLKDCSQVLFTGIDNDEFQMEVRMRYRAGLFAVDELHLIKSEVKEAIQQCKEVFAKEDLAKKED